MKLAATDQRRVDAIVEGCDGTQESIRYAVERAYLAGADGGYESRIIAGLKAVVDASQQNIDEIKGALAAYLEGQKQHMRDTAPLWPMEAATVREACLNDLIMPPVPGTSVSPDPIVVVDLINRIIGARR